MSTPLDYGRAALRQIAAGRWWERFPAFVLVIFALLVALDLNGSSISMLVPPQDRTGVLVGIPRKVRSDEILVQTPISVSSALQDFPDAPWIGLTPADQAAAAHGGPTRDWATIFRPQDWGYLALGAERGLAWSWWWSFAVSLWGCFALFRMLTGAAARAALLSVVATFTPYSAWWTSPAPSLSLGYAAGIGALLVAAWSARDRRVAASLTVAAAGVAIAFALALYPPWQVTLVWVVALTCLGVALDARLSWRRLLWTTATTTTLAAAAVAAWYLQHAAAITATMNTYYPGHRVSHAGGAHLEGMLSAPVNFWLSGHAGAALGASRFGGWKTNLSEVSSSWLSLPLLLMLTLWAAIVLARSMRGRSTNPNPALVEGARTRPTGPIWTLALSSLAALLLLAWAYLPLPDLIGKLTLLNRVPPVRLWLALGLVALVQVSAASMILPRPRWAQLWLVAAAAGCGALAWWAYRQFPWNASQVPGLIVALSGLAMGTGFALTTSPRRTTWGAALLAVMAVGSWGIVNPVQRGLDGVLNDPLIRELRTLTGGSTNPRTEVFGDFYVTSKVRLAGLQSLGGVTLYPNSALMGQLAPTQERLWNNYVQYVWTPAPSGTAAVITPDHGTRMLLAIDPCDPALLAEATPGWVVSVTEITGASCMTQVSDVAAADGVSYWIYRVNTP